MKKEDIKITEIEEEFGIRLKGKFDVYYEQFVSHELLSNCKFELKEFIKNNIQDVLYEKYLKMFE